MSRRITRQMNLDDAGSKFSINNYINGLANQGTNNRYYGSRNSEGRTFAQSSEFWEDAMEAFDNACSLKYEGTITGAFDNANHAKYYLESKQKFGFYVSNRLANVVADIIECMPYLEVLPYFEGAVLSTKKFPVDAGCESVVFKHKGDDFPCGAVTWAKYASHYTIFSPLTADKRNGKHHTENNDRLVSLARKYFKYRAPPRIAAYVAFNSAAHTNLEEKHEQNNRQLERVYSKITSFGGDRVIAKDVYLLLRNMHEQGHVFEEGKLNEMFEEIARRHKEKSEYGNLARCIMYARMLKDSTVSYAFYYKDGGQEATNDPAFEYNSANYTKVSPMYNSPMVDMPVEFIAPVSQLALEEKGEVVDKLGIRLNHYEYVLYAEGVATLLDDSNMWGESDDE